MLSSNAWNTSSPAIAVARTASSANGETLFRLPNMPLRMRPDEQQPLVRIQILQQRVRAEVGTQVGRCRPGKLDGEAAGLREFAEQIIEIGPAPRRPQEFRRLRGTNALGNGFQHHLVPVRFRSAARLVRLIVPDHAFY